MRPVPFFLLLSMGLMAPAADNAFRAATAGPTLGFTYDAGTEAIRPIHGIPGAALLGDPIDIGFPIALAAVAPLHDLALAVSGKDGLVRLVRLQQGENGPDAKLRAALLGSAMASPNQILFSPSGASALLYSSAGGRVQVVTGLSGQPMLRDLPLETAPGPMALADDGLAVLVAAGDGLEMQFTDSSGPPVPLGVSAVAGAFRRGSEDAFAVTASGDAYFFDSGVRQWREIHPGDGMAGNPVGAQLSTDGALAYVADASGTITALNLSTGESSAVACNCAPTSFDALLSASVFRLTSASSSLLWLVDTSQARPRMWFVPRRNSQ